MKRIAVYAMATGVFFFLALKYLVAPWIWAFVSVVLLIAALAFGAKKRGTKIILCNVVALPLALSIAESYLYLSAPEEKIKTGTYVTDGYSKEHERLGYAPMPGIERTLKVTRGDEVVYDVTYAIDDNGLRRTPTSNDASIMCLLFFGGSFAFGEGLDDDETLPYFVGRELNGEYRISNFGFHGYGPHQMLSAIQTGLVGDVANGCQEIAAVYSAIPAHVARAVGHSSWDKHGPRYVLEKEALVYKGHFDAGKAPSGYIEKKIERQLRKSLLFRRVLYGRKSATDKDLMTFVAIIEKSHDLLRENSNFSKFLVLFWDPHNLSSGDDKDTSKKLMQQFSNRDFEHYLVGDILDGYKDDRGRYSISAHDAHPNAQANQLLAKYLVGRL
ncbi:MAG: hypothetical protein ACR2RB_17045 [Gammaproteobacteria bacterium]